MQKSYISIPQLLPVGDNGTYRPVKILASISNPIEAAYYRANPSVGITSSIKGGNEPILPSSGPFSIGSKEEIFVEKVDTFGYWDINGNESTTISFSWNAENQLESLLNSDLNNLIVVGWDGTKWAKIISSKDQTSIFGDTSNLLRGSITTISIVPSSFEVYALAKRVIPKDTLVTPISTDVITIALNYSPDKNISIFLSGPFHQSGTATVDSNGLILFTPNALASIGIDTLYRIRAYTTGGNTYLDTFTIYIRTPLRIRDTILVIEMNNSVTSNPLSFTLIPKNTVSFSFYGSFHGSTSNLNNEGNMTYKPKYNYIGLDSIYRVSKVEFSNGSTFYDTSIILIYTIPKLPDLYIIANKDTITSINPMLTFGSNTFLISSSSSASARRGRTILNADGTIEYTPYFGFSGIDTIRRIICVSIFGQIFCDTSYIFISIKSNALIASYISPNGDGVNDAWVLPSALFAQYPNLKVIIYNRWGNIIWRSKGVYQNNWSGVNIDNANLPDGVYYYMIELKPNLEENLTGFIEVMRQ